MGIPVAQLLERPDHVQMLSAIIEFVCCSRCPVNSFTDISFIMVVHRENTFWAAGDFWKKSEARLQRGLV